MTDPVRPFGEFPGGPIYGPELVDLIDDLASGIEVAAMVVPIPEAGPTPGIILSFGHPDGTPGPRIALVMDPDRLAELASVVTDAVASAIKHTLEARR